MTAAEDKRPRHFEQREQTPQGERHHHQEERDQHHLQQQQEQQQKERLEQQQQQQGQEEQHREQRDSNHEHKEQQQQQQQQQAEPTAAAAHLEKQERELRLRALHDLTPEAYLDQTGVSSVLEGALALVARLRPQDPLNLLSDM